MSRDYANEIVEIEGTVKHETDAAVLIDLGGPIPVWIPRSQIMSKEDGEDGFTVFEITAWIAEQKGLV